jgi:hypothetical protein
MKPLEPQTTWWWCINHGKLDGAPRRDDFSGVHECFECKCRVYLGLKDGTPHNLDEADIKSKLERGEIR